MNRATTARGDRRRRGGARWWCALPDLDTVTFVARLLATEADTVVAHGSGRPWLFGCGIADEFRTVVVGLTRVAVIGICLATDLELRTHVESTVRRDNVDPLATLPGSYHLVVSGPAGMLVFGDIAGFRRVFTTRTGAITVTASHAGVLRRLVNAPVNRTWLAARLASPEMPSLLRESLSPFEGVRVIPAGHCLTMRHNATRHTPCWTPPLAVEPLSDGAHVLAEAFTSAVAGRVRDAGGPVSVQLSGGLDSTAVSCLAGNAIRDRSALLLVTTASISPGNDDLSWAHQVADHLIPAEHLVLGAQETPCFFDDLPTVESETDEPAPFTAAAARVRNLAAVLAGCGIRVHLNGQGGDEVLLAPLTYLHDALRAHPRQGWRHLRGQAALRDLNMLRLTRSMLAKPSYRKWLRWAADTLRTEAPAETAAAGWEAQPLVAQWASSDAEQLVRAAILAAQPTATAGLGTHAALVRIRSTAYRAALYRDALAGHGVRTEFPSSTAPCWRRALPFVPGSGPIPGSPNHCCGPPSPTWFPRICWRGAPRPTTTTISTGAGKPTATTWLSCSTARGCASLAWSTQVCCAAVCARLARPDSHQPLLPTLLRARSGCAA